MKRNGLFGKLGKSLGSSIGAHIGDLDATVLARLEFGGYGCGSLDEGDVTFELLALALLLLRSHNT